VDRDAGPLLGRVAQQPSLPRLPEAGSTTGSLPGNPRGTPPAEDHDFAKRSAPSPGRFEPGRPLMTECPFPVVLGNTTVGPEADGLPYCLTNRPDSTTGTGRQQAKTPKHRARRRGRAPDDGLGVFLSLGGQRRLHHSLVTQGIKSRSRNAGIFPNPNMSPPGNTKPPPFQGRGPRATVSAHSQGYGSTGHPRPRGVRNQGRRKSNDIQRDSTGVLIFPGRCHLPGPEDAETPPARRPHRWGAGPGWCTGWTRTIDLGSTTPALPTELRCTRGHHRPPRSRGWPCHRSRDRRALAGHRSPLDSGRAVSM
jgi:hypothetical protein